jgi:hypothetical protein
MKFVFKILDLNSDNKICENDLLEIFENQSDRVFFEGFSEDVVKIIKFFQKKAEQQQINSNLKQLFTHL